MKKFFSSYSYVIKGRILFVFCFLMFSCSRPPADDASTEASTETPVVTTKYLYVSTGLCQAGANTTFSATTSTNRVYRLSLTTGAIDRMVADYTSIPATTGDSPVGIAPYDEDYILVLVERSGARRVEKVPKSGATNRSNLTTDATLLANTLLGLTPIATGGFFISRTNAIGKMSDAGITQVATFVGNAPGGSCGATNNKYSTVSSTLNGHLFFANSVASNNRIGVIQSTGTTCLAGMSAPQTAAFPSSVLRMPDRNQFLVAFAGNSVTNDINSIQVYEVTETTSTASISGPTEIYDYAGTNSSFSLYSVPSMAFDSSDNSLYIATAISTATTVVNYNIEKFSYDPDTKVLTKPISTLFRAYSADSKCISGMFIDN